MEIKAMYEQLGISRAVYEYGERVLRTCGPALTLLTRWQNSTKARSSLPCRKIG